MKACAVEKRYYLIGEIKMKLSAPKNITFWVAVVLGVLGFLGTLVSIPLVSANAFWFVFLGFVVLVLGVFFKDF